MARIKPTKAELKNIDELVEHFQTSKGLASSFMNQVLVALEESPSLQLHIHSLKSRIKEESRLRDKLVRKLKEAKGRNRTFGITAENLLVRISDLAGIRILHLHTRQLAHIHKVLQDIFKEQQYKMAEKPFARSWDDESRDYFRSLGIKVQKSPTLYTSIHYVIESASRTKVTCEIQVRTLMEEVWGEVDHSINYPQPSDSVACREQIKALARATSSASRLVDSIFATNEDLHRSSSDAGSSGSRRRKRLHPRRKRK